MARPFSTINYKKMFNLPLQGKKCLAEIKEAFFNDHLAIRKYIMTYASTHFEKDKFEPAPLLNRSLLDVGCGINEITADMVFRGADVTAIDIDKNVLEEAATIASKRGANIRFVQGEPSVLVKEDKKYDIILCVDVFEHVPHVSKFIQAIKQLMHEESVLIFYGKNRTFPSFIWHTLIAQWMMRWVPTNAYRFNEFRNQENLEGKLADKGFTVTDVHGLQFPLCQNKWVRREKKSIRYLGTATLKK